MNKSTRTVININFLFYKMILLLPCTTLIQGIVEPINTIVFAIIAVLLLYLFSIKPMSRSAFITIIVLVLNHAFALLCTDFGGINNMNTLYYFAFWILFSVYVCSDHDNMLNFIKKNERFVCSALKISSFIMFVSIFMPYSYTSGYFKSFSGSSSRACSVAIFIMVLIFIIMRFYDKKKYIWFSAVPIYCIVMGDSRTYLAVFAILFIIVLWYFFDNKKYFYLSIIPVVLISIGVVVSSNIMNKIIWSMSHVSTIYNSTEVLTSGRSSFWLAMLTAWWNTDWIHIFLGDGFHFVYTITLFWAHNDFIQILLTFGIVGLLIYLINMKNMLVTFFKKGKTKWFIIVFICLVWFINAFFNMFYVYLCACMSFPFLLLAAAEE